MKKLFRLKSLILLLLLAVSIFPFKVFCHTENSEIYKTLSINNESPHHDCPFCSFQFCHEFESSSNQIFSLNEISLTPIVFTFEKRVISFSEHQQNKGPPAQLL